MDVKITPRLSRDKQRLYYTVRCGGSPGQRRATGIFTFTTPSTTEERLHNKEALHILEIKRSQLLLDMHCFGMGILPSYRHKANFLDFYEEFVRYNKKSGNRHLEGSLQHFKSFLTKKYLDPIDVTEEFCAQYRKYLLDHINGDTPANYFSRFKRVIKAATRQGYFRINPSEDLAAKGNHNKIRKDHLESDEYIQLLNTPCLNEEIKDSFFLCCYTGMRWCDVKSLQWKHIIMDGRAVCKVQQKTKGEQFITLHPIASLSSTGEDRGCILCFRKIEYFDSLQQRVPIKYSINGAIMQKSQTHNLELCQAELFDIAAGCKCECSHCRFAVRAYYL